MGAMMGIPILRYEGQAARQAEAEGLLEPGTWVAVSDSDLDLAKALIWSSIDLFDLTPQHTAGAYMAQEEAVARCAVLAEAGFRLRLLTSRGPPPLAPGGRPVHGRRAVRARLGGLRLSAGAPPALLG